MRAVSKLIGAVVVLLVARSAAAAPDEDWTRDEVAVVKRKLVAVIEALGTLPAGYSKEAESFDIPTSSSRTERGGYYPAAASAHLQLGSEKTARKSDEERQAEYQKKILEAQARGDYQALTNLAMELQQQAAKDQLAASGKTKEPVDVTIQLNAGSSQAIDPDGVLLERPGVIALRLGDQTADHRWVAMFFDPVRLASTKTLARVKLADDEDAGVKRKATVRNVEIDLRGPAPVIEAMAKSIMTSKVLAQIDPR